MKPFIIKHVAFGEGKPKICIPIVGRNEAEILKEAEKISQLPHDVVEWRCDFFEAITNPESTLSLLSKLKKALPGSLLLFTFRTAKEGGSLPLPEDTYLEICENAAKSSLIDLLDLEFFTDTAASSLSALIALAHRQEVGVILSNHDFHQTPPEAEILRRLSLMEEAGADLAKIAVMPKEKKDVLTLLSATLHASSFLHCPVITMSMGSLGVVSRLCGETFGSCLTFGSAGKTSAPGQIDALRLAEILDVFHR